MEHHSEEGDIEDIPSFSNFLSHHADIQATHRYLPHWQLDKGLYFVTWRLADSLPQSKLREWVDERNSWLAKHPKPWDRETREYYFRQFPQRFEAWLDAGYGACELREPVCAAILARVMLRFDGDRYDIASFVVMANHVHVLLQLRGKTKLELLLKAWKGTSSREINLHLGRQGTLWMDESRDTSIRNPSHLVRCYHYIRENPAKAKLPKGEFFYYERDGVEKQMREWSGDID